MDRATQRLLDAVAERAAAGAVQKSAESTRVEKKSELELLLERYRLWIKILAAAIALLSTAGATLYGYVQSYIDSRVRESEAAAEAARKQAEAAQILQSAAGHMQAEHVNPATVTKLKDDVQVTGETVDALVEYNRQSHEYLLEVVAPGKRKPKKPPELERAEAKLDQVEAEKVEKARARKRAEERARLLGGEPDE